MENYMWIIWLALLVIAAIAEAATAALVSIWFAIGALFALICSFIPGFPFWAEIIVFLGGSLLCFLAIRPFLSRLMKKKIVRSNVDSIIGRKGVLLSDVSELSVGSVSIDGVVWTACLAGKEPIEKGKTVLVKAIEGNKLLVEEIKEGE